MDSGLPKKSHVQSVARSLMLLELLARENREMPLTDISRAMGWPKSTVHGLINTLKDYHYVEQSPDSGCYKLGVRLFELGNIVARSWDIKAVALPAMQILNGSLGELVQLATEDRGEVLYLEKLDSTHMMRIVSEIGARLPMHCTGLGKVLLAYKTPSEIKWILSKHGMPRMTKRTITDRELLERELIRIRRQGYAVDDREIMDSLRCVAAPIFDRGGNVKYAISISGLANNFHGLHLDKARDEIISTAASISKALGYSQKVREFEIFVSVTGARFFCREDEFVLEAMKRARCGPVHYGCFGGGCGVCKMKIASGSYQAEKRMSAAHVTQEEQKEGIVLICCVKPRENLVITGIDNKN
ncbi:MAG: helix-turn-helix domain-containing protein [Oscillospiraceae bacterium]|nr:helix-turn-helix domain-containing protein [Oscillospiraceae bacterium]